MKIFGYTISKEVPVKDNPKPTLVVTGQCNDKQLKEFENHCQKKGQCVIATSLPVLGVFNMQDPSIIPKTEGHDNGL